MKDDEKTNEHLVDELVGLRIELQETRQYLTRLLASSTEAIISTDEEGKVVLFNEGAEALAGNTNSFHRRQKMRSFPCLRRSRSAIPWSKGII